MSAFYRLPHRILSGSENMTLDRSLLGWVCASEARLVFRTYGWERPTLSLGRSEPYPEGWDEDAIARAGIDVARRPTGGNAVLHVEEVTFALAASLPGPWRLMPRGFANAAAEALAEALRSCGLEDARLEGERSSSGGDVCFARTAPGEVLARGYKVAGLASRFDRGGALCHASVPLTSRSRSIATFRKNGSGEHEALERNARSVGELLPGPLQAAGIGDQLATRLGIYFGVRWEGVPLEALWEPVSST